MVHTDAIMDTRAQKWLHLKAVEGFLLASEESVDWALLLSFCDNSNLCISVFKQLHSTGEISKESITMVKQLLIENRFHVTLRIISPYVLFR